MSPQHRELAQGRWCEMPFLEQMANIGSEVVRALNWKARGDEAHRRPAFERALELIDLTLEDPANRERLRELTRAREALVDHFEGNNTFSSTEVSWKKYFMAFTFAARRDR